MPPLSSRSRWLLALVFVLATAIWFGSLGYRKLIPTDEGRYAEIPREMVVSGDWVTPRSNDFKYLYKPPLQYWATAVAFEIFGIHEFSARLWAGLTSWLAIVFTAFVATRVWGAPIGVAAAAILMGSLYWVVLGHFNALDMGLAAFVSMAVGAIVLAQRDTATDRERRSWMTFAWAATGLAVLSKGLVGFVLPAGALFWYIVWQRDWHLLTRLAWLRGLAVFFAITVPWFVLVSARNPEFLDFFFVREHFARFLTREHGRFQPWWYFVPLLAAGLLPFTLAAWHAARAGLARAATRFQPQRFLLVHVVITFTFFSLSSSKLASYVVPVMPALATLAAIGLAGARARTLAWQWIPVGLLGLVLAWIAHDPRRAADLFDIAAELDPFLPHYSPWIVASGLLLTGGVAVAIALVARRQRLSGIVALAFAGMLAFGLLLNGHESLAPIHSAYHLARETKSVITPRTRLYFVETYDHTFPFYLGRTGTMVAYRDELQHAIAWEPDKFIPTMAEFERRWREDTDAVAFMNVREYQALAAAGLPMQVVAQNARRVVVKRP